MDFLWHLYLMAVLYISTGILHFVKPKFYLRIIPDYLPNAALLVYLSGIAEIILGIGLFFHSTRIFALFGIIAMLLVFLLVHFNMLSSKKAGLGLPKWILILRILLQFVLAWWAWYYISSGSTS